MNIKDTRSNSREDRKLPRTVELLSVHRSERLQDRAGRAPVARDRGVGAYSLALS